VRAIEARDWERLAAVFAPDFVLEDHRPLGLLMSLSRDGWVASVRALLELRPDARFRVHHALALDDRRSLTVLAWEGEQADGAFESGAACVMSYGAEGIRQWHAYGTDQLVAARACYEKLAAKAPPRIENAATRVSDRFREAWDARDWERIAAVHAPGCRVIDRRMHIELDRGGQLESLRFVFEMRSSRFTEQILATRGDRLALMRSRFEASGGNVGPSDVSFSRSWRWMTVATSPSSWRSTPTTSTPPMSSSTSAMARRSRSSRRWLAGKSALHSSPGDAGLGAAHRHVGARFRRGGSSAARLLGCCRETTT
jgi:hypothetical protein